MHAALYGWGGLSITFLASLGAFFHLSLTPENDRQIKTEQLHGVSEYYVSPVEAPSLEEPEMIKLGF